MRGSIIKQIFRVADEFHSTRTKKNKEWQEKLPIVVLKAEEILYSKANSEDEYMNLDTLRDRVNDAVNTIIRRDESTETGELLPPCVEAALNLGCIPVRASRSQRHSHPRTYLNLRPQEPASLPPKIVDKTIEDQCPRFSPLHSGNQFNFSRSFKNANSTTLVPESSYQVIGNDNLAAPSSYPSSYENIPSRHSKMMRVDANVQLKLGSVYPLYYGTRFQTEDTKLGSGISENVNSTAIFVGKPVVTSIPEPGEMSALPHLFSCSGSVTASKPTTKPDFLELQRRPHVTGCDLSLRLGLSGDPCMSLDRSSARETEDVGSISSQEGNKLKDLSSERNKEFCFFPEKTADNPHESCSSKRFSEHECRNLEAPIRTPKVLFSDNLEDVQFCWQPGLPSNQFTGQIRGPGL